jgi:hypothetical protein
VLAAACVVPSSPILVTLMKEAPDSSETSVFTRATRRNNPEDTILQGMYVFLFKTYDSVSFFLNCFLFISALYTVSSFLLS